MKTIPPAGGGLVNGPRYEKRRRRLLAVAVSVALIGGTACKSTEPPDDEGSVDFVALTSANPDVLLQGRTRQGEQITIASSRLNGGTGFNGIGSVALTNTDGSRMTVRLGSDGRPASAHLGGVIVLFQNYRPGLVDLAVLNAGGDVSMVRDVPVEHAFGPPEAAAALSIEPSETALPSARTLRWVGVTMNGVGCAIATASAVGTFGAVAPTAIPIAVATCTSFGLDTLAQLTDNRRIGDAARVIDVALCAFGSMAECVAAGTGVALDDIADAVEREETRRAAIGVTRGALANGGGTIQITLTWSGFSDVDLHVSEPSGFEIYWFYKVSPYSSGSLDRDDRDGFGPENIFWPVGGAPAGTYQVSVHHFSGSATENYEVLVTNGRYSRIYRGIVSPGQRIQVVTFQSGQPLPASVAAVQKGESVLLRAVKQ